MDRRGRGENPFTLDMDQENSFLKFDIVWFFSSFKNAYSNPIRSSFRKFFDSNVDSHQKEKMK